MGRLLDKIKGKIKSKERQREIDKNFIKENLGNYQKIIAYWRWYPDKFVDYLCSLNPDSTFKFYFSQRLYLRIVMRYRTVYAVFSRGFSKSFLAVLSLMLKAVLYPRAKLATAADGKAQSASILSSKMTEICTLIPALANEIVWDTRGKIAKTSQSKDSVVYSFKNGSMITNAAMTENTRGQRYQSLLIEESAKVDQEKLTEIIMPTLVISRQVNGVVDPNEMLNQSAVFVTSAGWKDTYAYDKLIQTLCEMVGKPDEAFILGGDWKIPVVEGLQPANYIQNQEMDSSLEEGGFDREYGSKWAGNIAGAFFDSVLFDKHRVINLPEYSYNGKLDKSKGYYIFGVDVGRFNCPTEVVVIKTTPGQNNRWKKQVVNLFSIEGETFILQAIKLKRLYEKFKPNMVVVDGNGVGAGLVDLLVVDTTDPDTGEVFAGWGVYNDEERRYRDICENPIKDVMYIMKANTALNTEMYSYCQSEMRDGRLKFLIDESTAKNKLLNQEQGKKMSPAQRAEHLLPFAMTSLLKSQLMNLIQDNEGANIILKQSSRKIKKDKFSALIYGLYWCLLEDQRRGKKKNRDISKMTLYTKVGKF